MARDYDMTMSGWDALPDDDRDWALALADRDARKCPVCGGDDPDKLCQSLDYQHAWVVTTKTCFKQRAVLMHMEQFKDSPFISAIVPSVRLEPSLAKSAR